MKYQFLPALVIALATACGGTTVPLQTAPRTPAAMGVLEVKKGDNNNTIGTLRVEHLAPPQQLRNDLRVYVAWIRPVGAAEWQNLGQLMISESRAGTLDITVPYDQFEISVSAEADGTVQAPSEFVVMNGQIDTQRGS